MFVLIAMVFYVIYESVLAEEKERQDKMGEK